MDTMKNFFKLIGILCLTVFVATACSSDDDPANNDFFIGKYNGNVSYSNADVNKQNNNGSVQVVKVGNTYNFLFSDDIPDITGVEIQKNENSAVMIGSTATHYIKINANNLTILFLKDGATWTADANR